jgi:hypothetical protein
MKYYIGTDRNINSSVRHIPAAHKLLRSDSPHHNSSVYFIYVTLYEILKIYVLINFITFSYFNNILLIIL